MGSRTNSNKILLLTSLPGVIVAGLGGLAEGHRGLMHGDWYVGEEHLQLDTTSYQLTKFPGDPRLLLTD